MEQEKVPVKEQKNNIWLGKYFVSDDESLTSFVDDFKKIIKKKSFQKDTVFERLYAASSSILFYPKKEFSGSKKNILLVTHELSRTGAPIVVLDTAKILVNNGYFVTVISLVNGPLLGDFLNIGVPVVIMPDMKAVQYFKSETCHFFRKMDLDLFVSNFDLTIVVTATLFNFVRRYFNSDKKIIWWIHEGSASYDFLDAFMPKTITPNIKVLCGGEYAVLQLKNRGYHYYTKVLNYGVFDDSKKFNKNEKETSKIRFLLAGSVGIRKGQLILLEAIKKLEEKYNENSEFVFVGDACEGDIRGIEIMDEIKEYASKNNNVTVYTSIPREELYQMYQTIDVLVLASLDDPMPVVATENFMLGNICLCSTTTGTSYYIEDSLNGFVFESGNSEQLKDKIVYIIEHENELDSIKQKGRKIYEDYFDIQIFEKNILKLVGEVTK